MILDGFWGNFLICMAGLTITGLAVIVWWLVRQRINVSDVAVSELKNALEKLLLEVKSSNERLEANFKSDFSGLEKRLSDECREMEHRFSEGMKEMNNKNQANAARINEVSEGLLQMHIDVLEKFMPADRVEAGQNELRSLIKDSVVEIKGQLEKMNDRFMTLKSA